MKLKELFSFFKRDLAQQFDQRTLQQSFHLLLNHYTGLDRVNFQMKLEEQVSKDTYEKFVTVIADLKMARPIDYIIGETIFFGRTFKVDPSVLIPRPETEELVQLVIENEPEQGSSILDIGTGSGCIAITLQLEKGFLNVDACEVSKPALDNAIQNSKLLQSDVNFFELDILTENPNNTYEIVVSNPPYVKPEELKQLDENVIEFEPTIALAPEKDPLQFYKQMIKNVEKLLKPGGRFYWEIHEDLGNEVLELFNNEQFEEVKLIRDLFDRDRFVSARYVA